MTSDPARAPDPPCLVVVALSAEQRDALAPELAPLHRPGIELVFEDSGEDALDLVKRRRPSLVIVGMTVGTMDGLEFVAILLGKQLDFRGKVLVLPEKGDPFAPVLQSIDPATGKRKTEEVDITILESLGQALAAGRA